MRNLILTLTLLLSIGLSSCENNKVQLTQEQYKHLIGDTIKPEYPKELIIPNPYSGNPELYYIVLGSDSHNYVTNGCVNTADWKILFHYPNCKYCKKDSI